MTNSDERGNLFKHENKFRSSFCPGGPTFRPGLYGQVDNSEGETL